MIYIHKNAEIDAVQWNGENAYEVFQFLDKYNQPLFVSRDFRQKQIIFRNFKGEDVAINIGEFIVRDSSGLTTYPPNFFEEMYRPKFPSNKIEIVGFMQWRGDNIDDIKRFITGKILMQNESGTLEIITAFSMVCPDEVLRVNLSDKIVKLSNGTCEVVKNNVDLVGLFNNYTISFQ